MRPDEAEKVKSKIKESGRYSIIDKVTVRLNEKKDMYVATLLNLGIKDVEVTANYVKEFEKLLAGGIWCILQIEYNFNDDTRHHSPFEIQSLKPIQMPNMDMDEVFDGRKKFTKEEWIDVLLRSVGMEPEQGGNVLIPEGAGKAGHIYTVARGDSDMFGVYKLELQVTDGSGKFVKTGAGKSVNVKGSINTGFNYFKTNASRISASIKTDNKDFLIHIIDLQGAGASDELSLTTLITLCSGILNKPIQEQMAVIGSMTIGGTISQLDNLANTLQVASDAGARKILLPMSCVPQIPTVPADLFSKFQIAFYADPIDAVFKALGVK